MARKISGAAAITAMAMGLTGPQVMAQQAAPPEAMAETAVAGPACAGASATRWIAVSAEASDPVLADAPLQTEIEVGAGLDSGLIGFRISSESQEVRIEARADGDPAIMLMTADGDEIATNDDVETSLNSRIETTLGPGDYCVGFQSIGDQRIMITLQVARTDQPALLDEDEAGGGSGGLAACTPQTEAAPLADMALNDALAGGAISMRLPGADTTYLRFQMTEAMPVTLRAISDTLDPQMSLFDSAGGLVAQNDDDGEGTNARLDFPTMLTPGDYCVAAAALDPREGDILLSAETLDPAAFLRGAWRRGEIVPPGDGSYPVQTLDLAASEETVVLHDGSAQWFALRIDQPTVIIARAFGSFVGVDPMLTLFSANGAQLEEADDTDSSTDAALGPILLEPGDYHIALVDHERRGQQGGPMRPVALTFERYQRVE